MKYRLQKISECTAKEACSMGHIEIGEVWTISYRDLNQAFRVTEEWNGVCFGCKCQWKVVEDNGQD